MRMFFSLFIASLLSLFIIYSCQKASDVSTQTSFEDFSVNNAKTWYGQVLPNVLSSLTSNEIKIKKFAPIWSKATSTEDKTSFIVESPLTFEKVSGFTILSSKQKSASIVAGKTKLLILKSKKTGIVQATLMHVVPQNGSSDEVSYKHFGQKFTGDVFYTDLKGNFINGWRYLNGVITQKSSRKSPESIRSKVNPDDLCSTIETKWYEQTCYYYDDGSLIGCSSWEYIGSSYRTYCIIDGGDGGGGGGYEELPPNEDENLNAESSICTKSFKFSKKIDIENGVGGWQLSGVTNIHMNIVDLTTGEVVPLALPAIYFGLPIIRTNGDFYSTTEAARIAAAAVEDAEQKVMEYYHSIGGALDVVGMSLRYRKGMDDYMKTKGGSATLQPGSNMGTVQMNNAVYSGIAGFNCL